MKEHGTEETHLVNAMARVGSLSMVSLNARMVDGSSTESSKAQSCDLLVHGKRERLRRQPVRHKASSTTAL